MSNALAFRDKKMKEIADRGGIILDTGGGARFTKWMKQYESLFEGKDYRTLDYDASTEPDVVGDIHKLPLGDNSIDSIICSSVLEHVADPIRAVAEMHRVLKPGGVLFLYVPSTYPYHARKGHYPDYWRFFEDTIQLMFKDWSSLEIQKTSGLFGATAFFVPFQSKLMPVLGPVSKFFDSLMGNRGSTSSGYFAYSVK